MTFTLNRSVLLGLAAFLCLTFSSYGNSPLEFPACGIVSNVEWSPFQISVVPYAQLFDSRTVVDGFNFSALLAAQHNVVGFSAAPFILGGSCTGIDVKIAGISRESCGLSMGCVSFTGSNRGVMCGVVNRSELYQEPFSGWQVGIYNQAVSGVQVGLLNYNNNSIVPLLPLFNLAMSEENTAIPFY